PGERLDVLATPPGKPGTEVIVRALPHNRGYGSEYQIAEDLFTIALSPPPPLPLGEGSVTVSRSINPISAAGATPVKVEITLVQVDQKTIEYRINDVRPAKLKPLKASIGETQIWTITNHTKWSHPIHLHGFFFQV